VSLSATSWKSEDQIS